MKNLKKLLPKKFLEIYQPPFELDDNGVYIWTANRIAVFNPLLPQTFENVNKLQTMVDILNGTSTKVITNKVEYTRGRIYIDNAPVLLIRGWGHLTGKCALNLSTDIAAKIQDDFAEWVVNKLKGNNGK